MAVDDDASRGAKPRPVPCPTSLVVKNGSKIRSPTLVGDAGAVVGDLDYGAVAVGGA